MSYLRMKRMETGHPSLRSNTTEYPISSSSVKIAQPIILVSFSKLFEACTLNGLIHSVDSDTVSSKMESGFSTPFDTRTLPVMPVPSLPKERTCAWLNSTHLPRHTGHFAKHPDDLQGRPLPFSPPTPRARQMAREGRFPAPQCCIGCMTSRRPKESRCTPFIYSPQQTTSTECTLVRQ